MCLSRSLPLVLGLSLCVSVCISLSLAPFCSLFLSMFNYSKVCRRYFSYLFFELNFTGFFIEKSSIRFDEKKNHSSNPGKTRFALRDKFNKFDLDLNRSFDEENRSGRYP